MFNQYHGQHSEPFIDIWDCQAGIARQVQIQPNTFHDVYCINSDELEDEILAEIDNQGGAINMSGRMYCPPELAAKAIWE